MRQFFRAPGVRIFLGCWLVVLLVPGLRLRLRAELQRPIDTSMWEQGWRDDDLAHELYLSPLTPEAERNWQRLWAEGDPVKLAQATEYDRQRQNLERSFPLIKRFPREVWLRSLVLRAGSLSAQEIPGARLPRSGPPSEPFFTAPDREKLMLLARVSQQVAPKNAFFPWMEAIYAFSLRRDSEGLAALKRAGQCTGFDDGTLEWVRLQLEIRMRKRQLLWEEKVTPLYGMMLPHYGPMQLAARRATFLALQKERAGQPQSAADIFRDLMLAGRVVRQNDTQMIGRGVGSTIACQMWSDVLNPAELSDVSFSARERDAVRLAANFSRWMATRRHPELSALATQEAREIASGRVKWRRSFFELEDFGPLGWSQFHRLEQVGVALQLLAKITWGAAALWVVLRLVLVFAAREERTPQGARGAAFSLGATMFLVGALAIGTPQLGVTRAAWLETALQTLWFLLVALWGLPALLPSIFEVLRQKAFLSIPRSLATRVLHLLWWGVWLASLCSLFVTFTTGGSGSVWSEFWASLWPVPLLVFGASSFVGIGWLLAGAGEARRVAFWCFLGSFLSGLLVVVTSSWIWSPLGILATIFFGVLGFGFLWRDGWRWKNGVAVRHFLERLQLTAAASAVVGSVFYLLVGFILLLLQKPTEEAVDFQLQKGQVAWVERELAQK